ncbi:MAG: patatin family protein [Clostridia bacterium]|nr:patatin family protein [Clostridia bacterium]
MVKYSGYDQLPLGTASREITKGCLILEGGAWRTLYTQGAVDALMNAGIMMETTIGVSAGAMSSLAYLSGQIGFSAHINLLHRHDPEYCGMPAFAKEKTTTGFTYFVEVLMPKYHFDFERFNEPDRKLFVSVTNCRTGKPEYFEKGKCDILRAVKASATLPYVSKMVEINGVPYLDGGCSERIPYDWAVRQQFSKIVVLRTRDRTYRKTDSDTRRLNSIRYRRFPELGKALEHSGINYNETIERIEADEKTGRCFVLAPQVPIEISRFEGDMERLGALYHQGYSETENRIPLLREYLFS